ncbi:MAG TPA: HAMP domain-containing sensor histidine kinase, partial [Elusimicrobiota bacterium]|nr:HAMP domain-containing sensor histidine kinase [Elusimicrobiota bacterium]
LQQEAGREYKMVTGVQVPRGFLEPFVEPVFTGAQRNLGKEVEVGWADGKHLYRVWVENVEEEEGKVAGFIVVIRDITFRKQWEYVQEQVLSGITHDLRGPLSAVMGYLDLMRRQMGEGANPKLIEYLKLAREAGVRLTQMVSDILDVVRFEQGKIDLQPEAIAISDIFARLKNIFAVQAEQKRITLKLVQPSTPGLKTWGDPKLLERIFDNLVGNAIKFTPSGGTISVSAVVEKGRKIFEVADTGRGIPREAQSRIFDKFQQVRPGDRSAGYGLGLAVAKFIVEAHKGEIRVESEVGVGSRFTFWVPDESAGVPANPAVATGQGGPS